MSAAATMPLVKFETALGGPYSSTIEQIIGTLAVTSELRFQFQRGRSLVHASARKLHSPGAEPLRDAIATNTVEQLRKGAGAVG
jgi:hypothetical protein